MDSLDWRPFVTSHRHDDVGRSVRIQYQESHYCDVIMTAMASQVTSLKIAYLTVYSGADERKIKASLECHNADTGSFLKEVVPLKTESSHNAILPTFLLLVALYPRFATLGPIIWMRSDCVASLLANDSAAFIWKLRCRWLRGLLHRQIVITIQGPRPGMEISHYVYCLDKITHLCAFAKSIFQIQIQIFISFEPH